jgi:5-methylthioadenosine/S-adenosylhomocysteine deaminase
MVFGHFVHPDARILDDCARHGCAVSWQPVANGRLASGVADVPALRSRGIRVGLGLDDQACTDVSDPWQSMRFGLYSSRAATGTAELLPADVLRMQTLGAAEVIGVADRVGSLEPGSYADFVVVDPRRPDVGPVRDPLAVYVLSMTLRNLAAVYVGGRLVSADGRSTSPLSERAAAELHARFDPTDPAVAS